MRYNTYISTSNYVFGNRKALAESSKYRLQNSKFLLCTKYNLKLLFHRPFLGIPLVEYGMRAPIIILMYLHFTNVRKSCIASKKILLHKNDNKSNCLY